MRKQNENAERRPNRRRVAGAALACVLVVAIALSGTYAWTAMEQGAVNETHSDAAPGGRLHDDFDGENKDVYVENYGNVPIYVRVRLDEYMEIGAGAGLKSGDAGYSGKEAESFSSAAVIEDRDTWTTHIPFVTPDYCEAADNDAFHDYWTWTMGGTKNFMPTFDKDKDSLKSDYQGPSDWDGAYSMGADHRVGDPAKGAGVVDEAGNANLYNSSYNRGVGTQDEFAGGEELTRDAYYSDGVVTSETHTAKPTLDEARNVMLMHAWKTAGKPTGNFWVYDADGWAYWANPLTPGEATSLLLSRITLTGEPDDEWYYAINAVGQFATSKDLGVFGTGGETITADAQDLLDRAAGKEPVALSVAVNGGASWAYVRVGETLQLTAQVNVQNRQNPSDADVTWTPGSKVSDTGLVTGLPADVNKTLEIKATSKLDNTKFAAIDVYVIPADASGVVMGGDGKPYVDNGDNTFNEIGDNGALGDTICGGQDLTPGTGDDRDNVFTNGSNRYLDNGDDSYMNKGADGKLGTGDDVQVWPANEDKEIGDDTEPDHNETTTPPVVLPDVYLVLVNPGSIGVVQGKTQQFTATVTKNGTPQPGAAVTWSLTGNHSAGTSIDADGLLTMSDDESNATVTVRATYTVTGDHGEVAVRVKPKGIALAAIQTAYEVVAYAKGDGTVSFIDERNAEYVLIAKKKTLKANALPDSNSDSFIKLQKIGSNINNMQEKINMWFEGYGSPVETIDPAIKAAAVGVVFAQNEDGNGYMHSVINNAQDSAVSKPDILSAPGSGRAFLLSSAEAYKWGGINNTSTNAKRAGAYDTWLRTLGNGGTWSMQASGLIQTRSDANFAGLRPALWVRLDEVINPTL
ncbi:MAG: hypothetical protein LBO81_03620 [Clostridiales Family XIII bacterium]|jgi:hypothetical protein|nr:hypothetical protein [Clostridiales Family XIII bacterium]